MTDDRVIFHVFINHLCVCVCVRAYTHILCVKVPIQIFLPRVLLGFLLTINFQGSYLYILKNFHHVY